MCLPACADTNWACSSAGTSNTPPCSVTTNGLRCTRAALSTSARISLQTLAILALSWVARHPGSIRHLLQGGLVLGLAVCVMHYLGMYGMRFGGIFQWSGVLVAASVAMSSSRLGTSKSVSKRSSGADSSPLAPGPASPSFLEGRR